MKTTISFVLFVVLSIWNLPAFAKSSQWNELKSREWANNQPWIVGANFIPASAVNTLEMWQKSTFNPAEIEKEFSLAKSIGMNSMRVFLHDLLWEQEPQAFGDRIEQVLALADKHNIKLMLVLFDSCWNAVPKLGQQDAPRAGVHNSRWVQSPGMEALLDSSQTPRLKRYVTGVVGRFAKDPRVLAWDVWNEPDNVNEGSIFDRIEKLAAVEALLPQVFEWTRSMDPIQPLTSGVWNGDWSTDANLKPIAKIQLQLSDVISFHSYEDSTKFESRISSLLRFNRAILCTEYMGRPFGNTVQTILPMTKALKIGSFNWGFVAGKTQTFFPWDSWEKPYSTDPNPWFHDLFTKEHAPYDAVEIKLIRAMTGATSKAP